MSEATMKAAVYNGAGIIRLENRPVPKIIDPTDSIVRVTLSSICSSDIHIRHGAVPRAVPGTVLGHEFVGVVEETGSRVKRVKKGDRVAVNVETFCGTCFFCQRGFVNNCTDPSGGWALGCRIDGGQAEYARIPFADNGLTPIPSGVSDEAALFTGDVLSTGYWGADMAEIEPGDTVAVIGAGPTGLCTMMCARLYGPRSVIAIDISDQRLSFSKCHGLADVTLNPNRDDVSREIKALTSGRGADCVLEAAGGGDTFQTAWNIARPNAIVCVIALYEEAQLLPLPNMYGKNLTFKTGGVDANSCKEILERIGTGQLDTRCLITHRTDLSHIMDAYERFEKQADGVIKYAIRP